MARLDYFKLGGNESRPRAQGLRLPRPDDRNPSRIAPPNLFDLTIGEDNLLHRKAEDPRTLLASLTIVNLANKVALDNFLSTFSGTHYVPPRTLTEEIAYHS